MNSEQAQAFEQAKARLSVAAARLLAGDRTAVADADQALTEVKQIMAGADERMKTDLAG